MRTYLSQFQDEIQAVVRRWAKESDLTRAELVGVLEIVKTNWLNAEPKEPDKQDEEHKE